VFNNTKAFQKHTKCTNGNNTQATQHIFDGKIVSMQNEIIYTGFKLSNQLPKHTIYR